MSDNRMDTVLNEVTRLAMKIEHAPQDKIEQSDARDLAVNIMILHGWLQHGIPFPEAWMRHRK